MSIYSASRRSGLGLHQIGLAAGYGVLYYVQAKESCGPGKLSCSSLGLCVDAEIHKQRAMYAGW